MINDSTDDVKQWTIKKQYCQKTKSEFADSK